MRDEKPAQQTRSVTDVAGVGEATKSIFDFFGKILDKLPFDKLTGPQTFFLVVLTIVNVIVVILAIIKVIVVYTVYVIIAFDLFVLWRTMELINLRGQKKKKQR